ncbi:MAG: hypothetical protein JWQ94_4764 [Tardiphaga sp.]|jgi:hypothetical protein|nr:hypothetical protein [Tardiphaga sp.]
MSDTDFTTEQKAQPPRRLRSPRAMAGGALLAVLVVGAAVGAGGTRLADRWQPHPVMLLQPAPIDKMQEATPVAVKGEVAEVFGNKFIVQDSSGRALIDTGPRGERAPAATKGETLSVQGRFDRGVLHADIVSHADGRNEAFGPPHGPKGPKEGPSERADRGPPGHPDRDADAAPPPR